MSDFPDLDDFHIKMAQLGDVISFDYVVQLLTTRLATFCECLSQRRLRDAKLAISPEHNEVWDNFTSPFLLLTTCDRIYFELSFLDSSSKRNTDIGDIYSQVAAELDTLSRTIEYARETGQFYPNVQTSRGSIVTKRPLNRADLSPIGADRHMPVQGTAPARAASPTALAQADKLQQLLHELRTLVGTRLAMVDVYSGLQNHAKTWTDVHVEMATLQRAMKALSHVSHNDIMPLITEARREICFLIDLLALRETVSSCRFIEAVLGIDRLRHELEMWITPYRNRIPSTGSNQDDTKNRAQLGRQDSEEWSLLSAIVKVITGSSLESDRPSTKMISQTASASPQSSLEASVPRVMSAARWMQGFVHHLANKLEFFMESIRTRLLRQPEPNIPSQNPFIAMFNDVLGRSGALSYRTCVMIIAHDERTRESDLKYAYVCEEPSPKLQQTLTRQTGSSASSLQNPSNDNDMNVLTGHPLNVRMISGDEFCRYLPSAENKEFHSRSNSIDSGVRHIFSDSSATGTGSQINATPPNGESPQLPISSFLSTDNLRLLDGAKSLFSEPDLLTVTEPRIRTIKSSPALTAVLSSHIAEDTTPHKTAEEQSWVLLSYRGTEQSPTNPLPGQEQPATPLSGQSRVSKSASISSNQLRSSPKNVISEGDYFETFFDAPPPWQGMWLNEYWSELISLIEHSTSATESTMKEQYKVHAHKATRDNSQKIMVIHSNISRTVHVVAIGVDPKRQYEQMMREFVMKISRELRDEGMFEQLIKRLS